MDTEGMVNITGDVKICNGGVFELNDFTFLIMLMSDSGGSLATFESQVTDLKPGTWTTFPVSFQIADATAASTDVQDLFFSQVTFTSMIYFSAQYILGFNIQTIVIGSAQMGPLVREFNVQTNQTTVEESEGNYLMQVPYQIETSLLLMGSNLYVTGTVCNETDFIGFFNTTASLGGESSGSLTMILSPEEYHHLESSADVLQLYCIMSYGPFEWEKNMTIDWDPPDLQGGNGADLDRTEMAGAIPPMAGGAA